MILSCIVFTCKDLSEYKYDRVVTKSLDILNKLYSSQEDMFKLADRAQVIRLTSLDMKVCYKIHSLQNNEFVSFYRTCHHNGILLQTVNGSL